MSSAPTTTRAQNVFLRALRKGPASLAPEDWPSAVIFRRWLRHPGFRRALADLKAANRFCADFELSTASAHAATFLRLYLTHSGKDKKFRLDEDQVTTIFHTLRLSHASQRLHFPRPAQSAEPARALAAKDIPLHPAAAQGQPQPAQPPQAATVKYP